MGVAHDWTDEPPDHTAAIWACAPSQAMKNKGFPAKQSLLCPTAWNSEGTHAAWRTACQSTKEAEHSHHTSHLWEETPLSLRNTNV